MSFDIRGRVCSKPFATFIPSVSLVGLGLRFFGMLLVDAKGLYGCWCTIYVIILRG